MGCDLHPQDRPLPGIVIRPAVVGDCARVAPDLREHDRAELRAVILGEDDESRLRECMKQSDETWAVEMWTRPVGLFGITRIVAGDGVRVGIPWCLGTAALVANRVAFIRSSKDWLAWLARDCQISCNVVSAQNQVHRRWLRWLGYAFVNKTVRGGLEFLEFVREEVGNVSGGDSDWSLRRAQRDRNGGCSSGRGRGRGGSGVNGGLGGISGGSGVNGGRGDNGDVDAHGVDLREHGVISDRGRAQHGAAEGQHEGPGRMAAQAP